MRVTTFEKGATCYAIALAGVAAVTAALAPSHNQLSSTTVALALWLVILFVATKWGSFRLCDNQWRDQPAFAMADQSDLLLTSSAS